MDVYEPSEPIGITIRLVNAGDTPLTLHFASSCQLGFEVKDESGNDVYVAEKHVVCLAVLTELTVQGGEYASDNQSWDQRDDSGSRVAPGSRLTICGSVFSYEQVPQGRCAEIGIKGSPSSSSAVSRDPLVFPAITSAAIGAAFVVSCRQVIVRRRRRTPDPGRSPGSKA